MNMVGSRRAGDFVDNDNEGWSGATINEVDAKGQQSLPQFKPNIATVLVGTNDMLRGNDAAAPEDLGRLIDHILDWPWLTAVIVSTLPPTADQNANSKVNAYNAAMPDVVKQRTDKGKWVVLVDTNAVVGVDDLVDGIHPNDAAYQRIARVFYDGIKQAMSRGWVAEAEALGRSS